MYWRFYFYMDADHRQAEKESKWNFQQIDDTYFENEEIVTSLIQLPSEWLRPIRKSERHFEDTQARLDLE